MSMLPDDLRSKFMGKKVPPILKGWIDRITEQTITKFGNGWGVRKSLVAISNIIFDNKDDISGIIDNLNVLLETKRVERRHVESNVIVYVLTDLKLLLLRIAIDI